MAEVMEKEYASKGKANAGLTLGIIGTSLAGLMGLRNGGILNGIFGSGAQGAVDGALARGELYNERKQQADYVEITKQYYEGQLANQAKMNADFFSLYKMNVDSSFGLYKQHVDDSFSLYKGQRDDKDALISKINDVERKVDVMSAIRPYQDALINCKIDNVALVADFNLARRTCRMIQGELVLPSTPTVTGYPSFTGQVLSSTSGTTVTA